MTIPRRFVEEPEGYREIPAFIPAGRPTSHQINPEWQQAPLEMLPDGRVVPQVEAVRMKKLGWGVK